MNKYVVMKVVSLVGLLVLVLWAISYFRGGEFVDMVNSKLPPAVGTGTANPVVDTPSGAPVKSSADPQKALEKNFVRAHLDTERCAVPTDAKQAGDSLTKPCENK